MSERVDTPKGRTTRRGLLVTAGAGAAAVAVAGTVGRYRSPGPPEPGTALAVPYVDGDIPLDGGDWDWRRRRGTLVALGPQQVAPPFLREAGLDAVEARALHNGRELAFCLEWDDPEQDDLDGIQRFHDAVAVQLPAAEGAQPPITMGGPDAPVHILQWRASWERDLEDGRTGARDLYPRMVRDLAPNELLGEEGGADYDVARSVGNPIATDQGVAVEEIVAAGFGSATAIEGSGARAHGVYRNGRWRVVVALPLERGDAGAPIRPGTALPAAFAVWLGSQGNRGGRKHFTDWVRCDLEVQA